MQTPEIVSKTAVKTRVQPKLSPMTTHINMSGGPTNAAAQGIAYGNTNFPGIGNNGA
jgi:hypothetical protein